MTLSKQQVKALLEVISADDSRPALEHAQIDNYEGRMVLVATDSYKFVALNIGLLDDYKEHVGKFVSREALTRWYKLASNRDMLGTQEIVDMAITDSNMNFPKWQQLCEKRFTVNALATTHITFNPSYAMTLYKLAGRPLTYKLHGELEAMVATTDDGMFVLMPLKA